eukprot:4505633-Alexandrium_andersonii.AAC.1
MTQCLEALCAKHEGNDHKYTLEFLKGAWEEILWAWAEALREQVRECKRAAGKDRLRKEELAFVALAPRADGKAFFQFPTTFDLEDSEGYYQR